PSTSTSSIFPMRSEFRGIWMPRCFSCTIMMRRVFSSSEILSSMVRAAVLGRGEYLKLNRESYSTSSCKRSVSWKSASVSPEQTDRAVSSGGELAGLTQDTLAGPAALPTARKRYHTVRTGFVATLDDGDVSAMRIVAACERSVEGLGGIQTQAGDSAVAAFE